MLEMFLTIRGSSAGQSVARSEGLYLIPPKSDSRTEVSFCWCCLLYPASSAPHEIVRHVSFYYCFCRISVSMPFLFRKLCIQILLVWFWSFPRLLDLIFAVLCALPINCLVRFPKQARLTPQNRSLFDKQCIIVKYFEVMKMELQRKIAFVLGESIVSCFRVLSCLTIEPRWSIFLCTSDA